MNVHGDPWFVAADLCALLGITDMTRAVKRLDDDETTKAEVDTATGVKTVVVVSEPGMYRMVLTSRSPAADKLRRWLAHEVLPAIRANGAYLTEATVTQLAAMILNQRVMAMKTDYHAAKSLSSAVTRPLPVELLDPDVIERMPRADAAGLAAEVRAVRAAREAARAAAAEPVATVTHVWSEFR